MRVLTPTGYKDIVNVNIGDELIAFDVVTGQEIINNLLSKEIVTPTTYGTSEETEDGTVVLVPDVLTAYVINNTWTLCKYQSVWVDGDIVKHASELKIGDIIFNGVDNDVKVNTIDEVIVDTWWRLGVSGDHSYIADNLTLHNASRFWVGGTGNWDASTTTNWSSLSGGSGGSSVPTSADDVTFDNLSNATLYTCTVTANANCANLTLNAPASGALTFTTNSSTRIINIYGNYSMAATNVTISYGGQFALSATSGTKTITSNGNNFVSSCLTFTGVGCTFQFADDLAWSGSVSTTFGQLRYVAGTIDPNSKTVSLTGATVQMSGNLTFYNLTRTGTTSKSCNFVITNGDITITNTFTCNGNSSTSRMWVYGYDTNVSATAQRTITSAINSITNSDFQEIKGAGAASWDLSAITGLSGDCGGNSGITFTTAATQTANGTTSFNWDTAARWTSRVPLPQDDVVVNNAFSAGQTVTMNQPRAGKTVTFGCTGSPTVSITITNYFFGGLDLSGVGTLSTSTSAISFLGRSSYNINMNGLSYGTGGIIIESFGGTYTLTNNLTSGGGFQLRRGTFDAATYNVSVFNFQSNYQVTRTLTVGSGTWNITGGNLTAWNTSSVTNLTYTTTPNINFTYSGGVGTRTISSSLATTALINVNVTAGTDTVGFATSSCAVNSVNLTGFSGTLNLGTAVQIKGDLTISTGTTVTAGVGQISFISTSTQNITTNGKNLDFPITINAVGGTVKLIDALSIGTSTARTLTLTAGTLDLNGNNLTHFGLFSTTGSTSRTLALGSNTYENTTTTAITIWSAAGSNFSITGTGTIKISGSTANIRIFAGGGYTYPTLWYTNATANGELDIIGSNTFAILKCTDTNSQSIKFQAGTTQTISTASGFQLTGAAGNLITLDAITGASTFTLSCAGNNAVGSYLSLTRCLARGGARWFAQNSIDNGSNNGWRFAQASNRQMSGIGSPSLII